MTFHEPEQNDEQKRTVSENETTNTQDGQQDTAQRLAERESVRAAALEEAADFVEQTNLLLRPVIADRIRSLKSAPAGEHGEEDDTLS